MGEKGLIEKELKRGRKRERKKERKRSGMMIWSNNTGSNRNNEKKSEEKWKVVKKCQRWESTVQGWTFHVEVLSLWYKIEWIQQRHFLKKF